MRQKQISIFIFFEIITGNLTNHVIKQAKSMTFYNKILLPMKHNSKQINM